MPEFDPSQIHWLSPWLAIDAEYAKKAELELHREVCAGHVLFGRAATAIGFRRDCDDVLFHLGESGFAVVHLTYQKETSPLWPETVLFDTLTAWVEQYMIPDAEDWTP